MAPQIYQETVSADNTEPHLDALAEQFYKEYTNTMHHIMTYDLSSDDLKRINRLTELEVELVRRVRSLRAIHG